MARPTAKYLVRRALRQTGLDVVRFHGSFETLQQSLLNEQKIELMVDVGANEGQYAQRMRQLGYAGAMVCFEPIEMVSQALTANLAQDPRVQIYRSAVGDTDGVISLNVSANTVSSSTLPMMAAHLNAAPQSTYVRTETVPLTRLDSLGLAARPTWLKVDVQGAELSVLRGASGILDQVRVLQLELSLVPLYEGGSLVEDVLVWARTHGFTPVFIEPGYQDPNTGNMLQAEGLFLRTAH